MSTPKPGPGGARPGAGRPHQHATGATVSRTYSLDPAADDAVQARATEAGVSQSRAASELILKGRDAR